MRITGTISNRQSGPIVGLDVVAFDKDLRSSQELGRTRTDAEGRYAIDYRRDQFARKEKRSADIHIEIRPRGKGKPAQSPVRYNAPESVIIDLVLGDEFFGEAEYTRLRADVTNLIGGEKVEIKDLDDTDEHADISFLSAELAVTPDRIVHFVVAHRLESSSRIEADFFYALLRTDVLVSSFSRERLHAIRFVVDLHADVQALYDDIALLPEGDITAAAERAISANIVEETLRERLKAILATLGVRIAAAKKADAERARSALIELIGPTLDGGGIQALTASFAGDYLGDIPALIQRLQASLATRSAKVSDDTRSILELVQYFGTDGPLIDAVKTHRGVKDAAGVRALAELDHGGWTTVLTAASKAGAFAGTAPDRVTIDREARRLSDEFARTYPSAAFTLRLTRPGDAKLPQPDALAKIVTEQPALDLASTNIDRLIRESVGKAAKSDGEKQAWRGALKTAQRLYKLAPSDVHARALISAKLDSAQALAALSRKEVTARLGRQGLSEEESLCIHERASHIHAGAVMLAGELKSLVGSLDAAAVKPSVKAATMESWKKDFPNLKTLFDLQDLCECADCRSVLGPGAYVADVLMFLKDRLVKDVSNPAAPATKLAKDALFARRPDIGDIDLDCENAFTEIPYIDVVNELLEELLSPDPGFAFAGPVATGTMPAIAAIVQVLDNQHLPLGARPAVTGPDLSGSYVLRGSDATYKLAPDGSGGFTVKRTRQTHGTSAERAAAPEYVSDAANQVLATKRIAFDLPFDAAHREVAAVFTRFDVRRADLMRALALGGSPSALAIAAEELGISTRVADIIVAADPAHQDEFWNTAASQAVPTFTNVAKLLDRTGVTYLELEDVKARDNADGGLLRQPFINPSGTLRIHRDGQACDTAQMTIDNFDKDALDKVHRFIRLWRASGLTLPQVNQAIRYDTGGAGALDSTAFVRLGAIARLARRTGQSVGDLLLLYGRGKDGWPSAVYDRIFANPANGAAASELAAAVIVENEAKPPATRTLIAAKTAAVAQSLARTPADIASLRALLPDDELTFVNLASLYALSSIARLASLPIKSFLALKRLSAIDPAVGPVETWGFLDLARLLSEAAIEPAALENLLAVSATSPDPRIPGDPAVTTALETLQKRLAAAYDSSHPAFDAALAPSANVQPRLDLLARLGELDTAAVARVEALTRGRWTDSNETPAAFLNRVFAPVFSVAGLLAVQAAWTALSGGNPDTKIAERDAFVNAVATAASDVLYDRLRTAAAVATIALSLKLDETQTRALLLDAHLKAVAAVAASPLVEILTNPALRTPDAAGHLPAVTIAAFPNPFAAVKLCGVVGIAITVLKLETSHVTWLLRQPSTAGFLELDALPYDSTLPAAGFASALKWIRARRLDDAYVPVDDPSAPGSLMSCLDVIAFARSGSATAAQAIERVAIITGWDKVTVTDLDAHFGFSAAGVDLYADPVVLTTIETAVRLLKAIGVTLADGVLLAQDLLTAGEVATAVSALRVRFEPSDWLAVQKSIQNGLRERRRDALASALVATDPRFATASDLYGHLLITVDMAACQPTSRIVQAHGTLQTFVERCLIALETSTVADTASDPAWARWSWMRNSRVSEANRRVFLYPEAWIEPELRDNKSSFFKELERDLAQGELTDRAAEDATRAYLEKLDEVAFLEHLACCYDPLAGVLHVFARTKGGDPATYYYRRFIKEREWTTWERVDLDASADHFVTFMRNRRLYLAWPLFEEEAQTKEDGEDIPTGGGGKALPPPKRLKIKLALSEYSEGKWLPKKLSKDALVSGSFAANPPKAETYRFLAMDLEPAGFCIVVTRAKDGLDRYIGAFSITGCKGYPEPAVIHDPELTFRFSPHFKDVTVTANRPVEAGRDQQNEFAFEQLPVGGLQQLFGNTPDGNAGSAASASGPASATFKVTYPWQMTELDRIVTLVGFVLAQKSAVKGKAERYQILSAAFGTWLPFFFEDHNRVYSIVPTTLEPDTHDPRQRERTASDILPGAELVFRRIADVYKQTIAKGQLPGKLVEKLLADREFVDEVQKLLAMFKPRHFGYRVDNAFHPLVCSFRSTLNQKGLAGLLTRDMQLRTTGFDFSLPAPYKPTALILTPRPVENVDFRKEASFAPYNWELFFHLPFEIAWKLSKNQRFEEAMRWFQFVFDPTGSQGGTAPQKFWITAPFYQRLASDYAEQRIENILYDVAQDPSGGSIGTLVDAIDDWRDQPFKPHVVARSRSVAYQKSIVLKYVDNLIKWGDSQFRQETMESVNRADQLYMQAQKLLGPKPRMVPAYPEPRPASFNELEPKLDKFSNALVELENLVPGPSGPTPNGPEPPPAPSTLTSLYFCIPPNETMLDYWTTIADRRFKTTHCKTIDGADRTLALFAPRIDPADLVRAVAQGLSIGAILAGLGAPVPPYRFVVTAQKAIEFIQELRTLGQELQQALEKRDGEDLALLRGTLEIDLFETITAMKEAQIKEATEQIAALRLSVATATERLAYYRSRPAVSELEAAALVLQGLSGQSHGASAALSAAAGVVNLLPNFSIGVAGFGGTPAVTATWGSANVAGGLSSFASMAGSLAGVFGTAGSMVGTIAAYERRKDEWDFQARLADKEIRQLTQQIEVAKIRQDITRKDLASHKKQIDNAHKTDDFMRSKFTNRELYDWMAGEASAIYFQLYDLAFAMAKKAERCFQHELGTTDTFIQGGAWDSTRKGLSAANSLMQQVRIMEGAYHDRNRREHELVKHVQLSMLDPMALLQLRNEGKCTVTIPEALFDLDHTGHYMRRLKSVSLSVPCIAGPYTSVACRLTLLSNRYRRNPTAANAAAYPENPGQDDRFVYNTGGIQSIATSQGQNDSGMFELNFRDERYLPFEGCGAIGTWQIAFGSDFRTIDRQTIEAVLHLHYTARDGGSGLKAAADGALATRLNQIENTAKKSGLLRAIDLRHEAPDAWARLKQTRSAKFTIMSDMLPLFAVNRTTAPSLTDAWVLARVKGQPGTFAFGLDGTPLTATKDVLVQGLCSTVLPAPLGISLDTAFTIDSAKAADLDDAYVLVRYQVT